MGHRGPSKLSGIIDDLTLSRIFVLDSANKNLLTNSVPLPRLPTTINTKGYGPSMPQSRYVVHFSPHSGVSPIGLPLLDGGIFANRDISLDQRFLSDLEAN